MYTKRIALQFILLFFFSQIALGQLISGYGVKGGIGLANQDFDYGDRTIGGFKHIKGLDVGIYVQWLKTPRFNLLTEVHYIQKGMVSEQISTDENGPEPLGSFRINNRVDYLSIPLLAKINLANTAFMPYLIIGPSIDFKLNFESYLFRVVYDDFRELDFTGNVGFGFQSGLLLVEARYSHGLRNTYETDLLRVKNRSFEALVGIVL